MPRQDTVAMRCPQNCLSTGVRYAHPCSRIFWSLVTQYLIGIQEEISEKIVVRVLDRRENPPQEPICSDLRFNISGQGCSQGLRLEHQEGVSGCVEDLVVRPGRCVNAVQNSPGVYRKQLTSILPLFPTTPDTKVRQAFKMWSVPDVS